MILSKIFNSSFKGEIGMMLFKLSYKNIKKSIKDYMIFFFTLVLGVMIFYIFSALDKQTAVMEMENAPKQMLDEFNLYMEYINVFIAIILGLLIVYASGFLLKRRKKEFALYMILGMKKRKISVIMFYETVIIGAVSLGVGLFLGTLASQGMSIFVIKLFEADMSKFKFVVSGEAIEKTILYFTLMYVIVVIFEVLVVGKAKLINLLNAGKKSERKTNKNPYICLLVFLVAAGVLSHCYWLAYNDKCLELDYFKISLIEAAIGTVLFFWALSGLIIFLTKKNKRFYLKGLRMFSSREISSRVNTNIVSATIICLLMFLTLCILAFTLAMRNSLNSGLKKKLTRDVDVTYCSYDDIINKHLDELEGDSDSEKLQSIRYGGGDELYKKYYDEVKDYSIENKLKEKNVDAAFKDATYAWTYMMPNFKISDYLKSAKNLDLKDDSMEIRLGERNKEKIITISDYNKLASAHKHEEYSLNDDEYIMICNNEFIKDVKDKALKDKTTVTIGDKTYNPKFSECMDCGIDMNPSDNIYGIIIVPDSVDKTKLYKYEQTMVASYNNDFDIDSKYKSVEEYISDKDFDKMFNNEDDKYRTSFSIETNLLLRQEVVGATSIIVFIGLYIGVIFMIVSAAILALKTLTDATDSSEKYAILRRIGVKEKMINRSVSVQNLLFFGLPVMLATVHSVFGIKFIKFIAKQSGMKVSGESITKGVVFMLIIYGVYFIVTNYTSKKIISE